MGNKLFRSNRQITNTSNDIQTNTSQNNENNTNDISIDNSNTIDNSNPKFDSAVQELLAHGFGIEQAIRGVEMSMIEEDVDNDQKYSVNDNNHEGSRCMVMPLGNLEFHDFMNFGYLRLKTKYDGYYKKRWCILTKNKLICHVNEANTEVTDEFDLLMYDNLKILVDTNNSFTFALISKSNHLSQSFVAQSLNDMIQWINCVQQTQYVLNSYISTAVTHITDEDGDQLSIDIDHLINTTVESSYLLNHPLSSMRDRRNDCNIKKCNALLTVSDVLTKYSKFIQQQNKINDNKKKQTFECKTSCVLEDFHHLLQVHSLQFEEMYNELNRVCHGETSCDLKNCLMMQRNHRDRTSLKSNDDKLRAIYFGCNDVRDITRQQVLDKIHSYFFHSFDTALKLSNKDKMKCKKMIKESDNDTNMQTIRDNVIIAISEVNRSKQKSFVDVGGMNRLISNAKFISTQKEYNYGFRFYYWRYYEDNRETCDPSQCTKVRGIIGNYGFTLGRFYVQAKYKNLKDELMHNLIFTISLLQFDVLLDKSAAHLITEYFRNNVCVGGDRMKYYDMHTGTRLGIEHLAAIMAYCNQDELQRKLSETYRLTSDDETIAGLKLRHRNYANWGRLLRELVDCFGLNSQPIDVSARRIYHGVAKDMLFKSMNTRINGPTSTTTEYSVALNFCDNDGIILELSLDIWWNIGGFCDAFSMFECWQLSDFVNEQEVFFIGGYSHFKFKTIIKVPQGYNYQYYVMALC
eukprot:379140_1